MCDERRTENSIIIHPFLFPAVIMYLVDREIREELSINYYLPRSFICLNVVFVIAMAKIASHSHQWKHTLIFLPKERKKKWNVLKDSCSFESDAWVHAYIIVYFIDSLPHHSRNIVYTATGRESTVQFKLSQMNCSRCNHLIDGPCVWFCAYKPSYSYAYQIFGLAFNRLVMRRKKPTDPNEIFSTQAQKKGVDNVSCSLH